MRIEFMASLPPIQSAIMTGSDGIRIKLDVPESDLEEAIKLVMLSYQP